MTGQTLASPLLLRAPARPLRSPAPLFLQRSVAPGHDLLDQMQERCPCGGGCPGCREAPALQPKLAVSQRGDPLEQEADRVAEEVLLMPERRIASGRVVFGQAEGVPIERCQNGHLCEPCARGKCSYDDDEKVMSLLQSQPIEEEALQAEEIPGRTLEVTHDVQAQVTGIRAGGQPLPESVRAFFTPRFGHDFSQVRIHTDARAAESARGVNALAYTVGCDMVFGLGQFAPGTVPGNRLLAHELTHVLQRQSGAAPMLQRVEGPCEDIPGTFPHPFLIRRSVHPAVREAQRKLNRFHKQQTETGNPGLADTPLVEDCVFGQHTFSAVVSFQRQVFPAHPEFHTGNIGEHTWAELDKVAGTPTPLGPAPTPTPGFKFDPAASGFCAIAKNEDLSGSDINPTTSTENEVALSNPDAALLGKAAALMALDESDKSGLPGRVFGPKDAFRHSLWNCLMAKFIGDSLAEEFGTGHENSAAREAGEFDRKMDLHNNAVGRRKGTPGADCSFECKRALDDGQLRTLRGPPADVRALEEGLSPSSPKVEDECLGPSDQPWP